jgi:general secretion pathway protein G
MQQRRRATERRVFFRWERRGSWLFRLGLHRARPFLVALMVVAVAGVVALRERRQAGIRQTRATLLALREALDSYLADSGGECPERLVALTDYGSFKTIPRDAWGRPFRLTCPGRNEGARYELASDGPDGKPGGLDRIE